MKSSKIHWINGVNELFFESLFDIVTFVPLAFCLRVFMNSLANLSGGGSCGDGQEYTGIQRTIKGCSWCNCFIGGRGKDEAQVAIGATTSVGWD